MNKQRILKWVGIVLGIIAIGVFLHFYLPYSPAHLRELAAFDIRIRVEAWKEGRDDLHDTPTPNRVYFYKTNLVFQGVPYAVIARLDSHKTEGSGYFVATSDPKVFWISREGTIKLMYPK